jgi:uncharacterized LabA/DUF88 family protein
MSTQFTPKPYSDSSEKPRIRVYGFVDGFNLYHSLQLFTPLIPVADQDRYRKYKWLCLTSMLKRYMGTVTDELVGVEYFTAYPNWDDSESKALRHKQYIAALRQTGVHVTRGEFQPRQAKCYASCGETFAVNVEKQTDTNIAISLINFADRFDKAILVTADSDQVPAVRLLKTLYPQKQVDVLIPIGRGAKDLQRVCDNSFKMSEQVLADCQLPSPLVVSRDGKPTGALIVKPITWP